MYPSNTVTDDEMASAHSFMMSSQSSFSSSASDVGESKVFDAAVLEEKLNSFDAFYFGGQESNADFMKAQRTARKSMNFDDSLYLDAFKNTDKLGSDAMHRSGALEQLFSAPTAAGDKSVDPKQKKPVRRGTRKIVDEACNVIKSSNPFDQKAAKTTAGSNSQTRKKKQADEDFVSGYMKEAKVGSSAPKRDSRGSQSKERTSLTRRSRAAQGSTHSPPRPTKPTKQSYVVLLATPTESVGSPTGWSKNDRNKDIDSSTHSYNRKRPSRRRNVKDLDSSTHSRGAAIRHRSSSPPARPQPKSKDLDNSTHRSRSARHRSSNLDSSAHSRRTRPRSTSRHARRNNTPGHGGSVDVNSTKSRSPKPPSCRSSDPSRDLSSSTHSRRRPHPKRSTTVPRSLSPMPGSSPPPASCRKPLSASKLVTDSSPESNRKPTSARTLVDDDDEIRRPASLRSMGGESRRTRSAGRRSRAPREEENRTSNSERAPNNRKAQGFQALLLKSRALAEEQTEEVA